MSMNVDNGDFNIIVEDQRNIVTISEVEQNTVIVTVPGLATGTGAGLIYGNGVPWEIEIEI